MEEQIMTDKHYEICAKMALIEILIRDEFNWASEKDLITDFLAEFRGNCGLGVSYLEKCNKGLEKDRRRIPELREERNKIILGLDLIDSDYISYISKKNVSNF